MKRRIILTLVLGTVLAVTAAEAALAQPAETTHACHDAVVPDPGSLPPPPLLDGIGQAHLQVSCSAEARRYFDQGLNLLHCFWDFEALRAFRETVRLDPSCAMGWWGIHRALYYNRREQGSERETSLARAVELSGKASEHERFYIRAASELTVRDRPPAEARAAFIRAMEALIDRWPDDIQARLLLADYLRQGYEPADGRPREGQLYSQAILRNLLARHPDNAAAHHYWIHAVENSSRPEDGLESAAVLTKLAPRCGHIAHMPGHIYYRVGDYEKARAAFLESREVDLAYMREQGIAPVNTWNYVHNLDYLVGSCAEDGRYQEGLRWADELARLPVDPTRSKSLGLGFILYGGQTARARLQIRYGFWDDAVRSLEGVVALAGPSEESLARDYQGGILAYARGMAAFGKGDTTAVNARIGELDALVQKLSGKTMTVGSDWYFGTAAKILAVNLLELRGALDSLEGRHDEAIAKLKEAVDRERDLGYWEPPHYTRPVVETLAGVYEKAGRWKGAREAWQHSLKLRPRNGHALYGLAHAWAAEGNRDEAAKAYEAFRQAWKEADRELLRPAEPPSCAFPEADAQWTQRFIDGWVLVSRELRFEPEPLPWIVLFDASCTWHLNPGEAGSATGEPLATSFSLAGKPVPVRGLPHGGKVRLPNGSEIPAEIMAAAFPVGESASDAFFALASISLWRSHPQASKDLELEERILSAALHEIVHTRQLPNAVRRLEALRQQYEIPEGLSDDTIEERFKSVPGFREAFEAERDLFYQAVRETDAARRRELIAQGLAKARERRARFFTGPNAGFAAVEDVFLNMEGAAEWARLKYHQKMRKPGLEDDAAIIAFLRGKENTWSQDEGFALVLLLDQERPGWQERVVSAEHAALFELLASP